MEQLTFSNAKGTSEVHMYMGGARRVQGEFFFSPDMRWFPLDAQQLEIVLEQLQSPVAEFAFVPDFLLNGMSPAVRFPGWQASLRPRDHADNRANCYTKVLPPTTVRKAGGVVGGEWVRERQTDTHTQACPGVFTHMHMHI